MVRVIRFADDLWGHSKDDGSQPRHLVDTEMGSSLASDDIDVQVVHVPVNSRHRKLTVGDKSLSNRFSRWINAFVREKVVLVTLFRIRKGGDVILTNQGLGLRASLLRLAGVKLPAIVAICYDPFPTVGEAKNPKRMILIDRFRALLYQQWEVMVLVSQSQAESVRRSLPNRPSIAAIPMAVDKKSFKPQKVTPAGFLFMVHGSLRDYQTLRDAIRDHGARVKELVIAHRMDLSPTDLRLLADIETADCRVITHKGVTVDRLRSLYANSGAVVIPILPSSQPAGLTALLEALTLGCAIVAPNARWVNEYAAVGQEVVIYEESDGESLAKALNSVLGNTVVQSDLRAASVLASERYSFEYSLEAMRKVLIEL